MRKKKIHPSVVERKYRKVMEGKRRKEVDERREN